MSIEEMLEAAEENGYRKGWKACQQIKLREATNNPDDFALKIIETVSSYYKIDPTLLPDRTRKREVVISRQMCMYLLTKYTKMSLVSIGVIFGNRDHTTVIHSRETIKDLLFSDPLVRKQAEQLEKQINSTTTVI